MASINLALEKLIFDEEEDSSESMPQPKKDTKKKLLI